MEPLQETRSLLLQLIADTSRHVDIACTHLEPLLLSDEALAAALTALARRGSHTRIRLLASHVTAQELSSHKLLLLAKRLTTAMEFRLLVEHPEWPDATWILCDQSQGLVFNSRAHRAYLVPDRARAKSMTDRFERLWQAAGPSPEMRQF